MLRSVPASSAIHLAATNHGEFITLVAGERPSLLMAGNNDEVYGTLRSGKSEAYVTITKESARRTQSTRGLSATAELLVI